jgi:hypothetical protein
MLVSGCAIAERDWRMRTVSVVMEICELVAPLCDYAQRVFEEGDNNQEAADCGEIAIEG